MRSKLNKSFRKLLAQLPVSVQEQAKEAYKVWQDNPYHPSLKFKRVQVKGVGSKQVVYSARISRDYRAMGKLVGNCMYWYWIGKHNEYDNQLS
jgi:hypothetical protein